MSGFVAKQGSPHLYKTAQRSLPHSLSTLYVLCKCPSVCSGDDDTRQSLASRGRRWRNQDRMGEEEDGKRTDERTNANAAARLITIHSRETEAEGEKKGLFRQRRCRLRFFLLQLLSLCCAM